MRTQMPDGVGTTQYPIIRGIAGLLIAAGWILGLVCVGVGFVASQNQQNSPVPLFMGLVVGSVWVLAGYLLSELVVVIVDIADQSRIIMTLLQKKWPDLQPNTVPCPSEKNQSADAEMSCPKCKNPLPEKISKCPSCALKLTPVSNIRVENASSIQGEGTSYCVVCRNISAKAVTACSVCGGNMSRIYKNDIACMNKKHVADFDLWSEDGDVYCAGCKEAWLEWD